MSAKIRSFDDFLALFPDRPRKKIAGGYKVICPCHADRDPSLAITLKGDAIGVKDFGGCPTEDILKAKGLTFADLFLNSQKPKLEHREIEAIYYYTDANGKPFEVVRTNPKGFYQRQPDGKGGYINDLKGITATLYHADELPEAIAAGKTIFVVEGEKDTDRLWSLGLVATTNPMGAGKWQARYSQALKGADLVIIPDNDTPGRAHANKIAQSCYDIAKRTRVLELLGDVKDISDWLDKGHAIDELRKLADTCTDYEPSDNGVKLRCMADIQAESVSWLWQPYIPKGKVTLVEGDPGIGKSWASLAIATAVSLGNGLPGQEPSEPAHVVIASAEDGWGDTVRPRLDAMGAGVKRIFVIDGPLILDENGFALLESYLEMKRPALLIIDPLVAYLGAGVDIHRANETRAVMSQLARLAKKFDVAIIAVRHLTKGGMSKAIYRGLGSIDFTAACRSVLLAGCDSENPQNRALVHIKSILALAGSAIGYELRDGGFYWTGESSLTAAQILAADSGDSTSVMDEAIAFLRDELASGPIPASQVFSDGKGAGLSEITIKRAKAKLGIVTRRQGEIGKRGGGRFTWELPDSHLEDQKDLEYQEAHIKKIDTLNNSSLKSYHLPKTDDTLNAPSAVLDMPVEQALEIWRSQGAPVIHLGPSENCFDLAKLLSRPSVSPEHLKTVKAWLQKHKGGEQC